MSEIVRVEQPNLVAFVAKIEELVNQGYKVSGTNSGVPSTWGPGLYTCEMISNVDKPKDLDQPKSEVKEPTEGTTEAPETTEYSGPKKTPVRRKTKSKSSE